ncbi:hypothetical protein Gotur_025750, partial [Gossypium turneri]
DISTSWRKSWHFSDTSWAKINVDGSNSVSQSRAAIGGVIRGPHKRWLVGFGMVTSLVDIFQVEAKAMLEGLLHIWIVKDWQEKLRLLLRDGNRVANCLDNEISRSLNQLIILDEPLIYVRRLLETVVYHTMSDVIQKN